MNNKEKALETLLMTDGYKLVHQDQYPKNTEIIFSSLFLRSSNHKYIKDDIYIFGLEWIKKRLVKQWDYFFNLSENEIDELLTEFESLTRNYHNLPNYSISRFKDLWKEKSLPLDIRVVKDRVVVPIGSPIITIFNTKPQFYWLTNYIESYLLTSTWPLITSSTTSFHLKKIFKKYLDETSDNLEFLENQGTDFSYRGMSGSESGLLSGIGHLANFEGSSTLMAINEFSKEWGRLGHSVPATEHSVMSAHGKDEFKTFEYLMDNYPKGLLSVVSDTWNIWNVIDNVLPKLKDKILSRDGKLVIRPDSGDPIKILMGDSTSNISNSAKIGLLKSLDDIFGHTTNSKGYKVLNSHIGIIYGDSITFETLSKILEEVKNFGYSTENIVFGLGATFYQNNNRDTFGHVFKSTLAVINGEEKELFKNPITNSLKKSPKGLVGLFNDGNGKLVIKDRISWEEFNSNKNILK